MTLSQIVRILWARRRLCFTVFCTIVGLVAAVSLLMPKEYIAEIALVVDMKGGDPLNDGSLAPASVPAYMGTQTEIIHSRKVALKVIDSLGLANDPATLQLFRDKTGSSGDAREWLVGPVLESLEAKTARNSNIIRIGYSSTNPQVAAAMANGFADAYIQASLELKVDPSRRQAIWFDEQVQQLRQELGAAQAKLSKYQSDFGVLGVDEARMDVENARLQEISNHLVTVQASMYDAETRRAQITSSRGNPEEAPDLLKHPVIQSLKSELARAEGKLAELGGRYDRNHPQFKSAAAEVASLRSKLDAEINLARGSLVQSAQIARRQVDEVQRALEEQKDRIIALKRQRDELSVLSRDVESARSAYDAALQQATKTRLESRVDRTNVAILNPAVVPTSPASPRVALNIAVAMIVGTLLAIGIALTLELHNRRLRWRDDLIADVDIAVLAELPRLNAPRRRSRVPALRGSPARLRTNTA
jgi:succinoglycan biosynthesis transport protein ExoP